jgi:hypothetical protein
MLAWVMCMQYAGQRDTCRHHRDCDSSSNLDSLLLIRSRFVARSCARMPASANFSDARALTGAVLVRQIRRRVD